MVSVAQNFLGNFKLPNGEMPCEGTKAFPVVLDFTAANAYLVDFTQQYQQKQFTTVQCVFIDNSENSDDLDVICQTTKAVITAPPFSQGFYTLLQPSPPVFQVQSNGNLVVEIVFLNFYVPPTVWENINGVPQFDGSGNLKVTDAALDAAISNNRVNVTTAPGVVLMTDVSGTITAGGTPQLLLAADPTRKRFTITNPSAATEVLQFAFGASGNGKIDIPAGTTWDENDNEISQQAIYIVAATTGHAFTAYKGN